MRMLVPQAKQCEPKNEKKNVKIQIHATQSSPLFFLENTKQQLSQIAEALKNNLSYI